MTNWPCYNVPAEAVCFSCHHTLGVMEPERSGFAPGTGAYVATCAVCRMRTFFDLRSIDEIQIGDRVAYRSKFLQATQAHELAYRRGTVIDAGGVMARVEWDDGAVAPVLAKNLIRVERIHLEPV